MAKKLVQKSTAHNLRKSLFLGLLITLATGLWEYEMTIKLIFLSGTTGKIRGLPLPYWGSLGVAKSHIDLLAFSLDLIFWFFISLFITGLFYKLNKGR